MHSAGSMSAPPSDQPDQQADAAPAAADGQEQRVGDQTQASPADQPPPEEHDGRPASTDRPSRENQRASSYQPASDSKPGSPDQPANQPPDQHPPKSSQPAPHRSRRWLWWLAGVIALALVVWLLIRVFHKPPPPKPPPPIPVTTAVAQAGDVPIYLDGIGTAQAYNAVTVRAQVDGTLSKIAFVEGQDVKAGDVLAQIDPRPLRAQLEQAVATRARDAALLANAKLDLQRYTTLVAQDSIATQQLDTQRALVAQYAATVATDQAQIDYAKVQLGYTTIVSPISGRTGVRQVDAGNLVHAADTTGIVTVVQLNPISVLFTLPEDAVAAVLGQMKAGPLTVSAMPRGATVAAANGHLLLVNNQVDATTGTVQLKATFANQDHALWPGQFVDVRLLLKRRHNAVTIPPGAVQRGPQGEFVFVVLADGTAQMRGVRLSTSNPGASFALIDAGLAAGERVVTDGQLKLRSGVHVRVLQPAAGAGAPAATPAPTTTPTTSPAAAPAASKPAGAASAAVARMPAPALSTSVATPTSSLASVSARIASPRRAAPSALPLRSIWGSVASAPAMAGAAGRPELTLPAAARACAQAARA